LKRTSEEAVVVRAAGLVTPNPVEKCPEEVARIVAVAEVS
jgi:hypothetical protein